MWVMLTPACIAVRLPFRLSMNKKHLCLNVRIPLILFLILCSVPVKSLAQFMNIHLDISPDMETMVEQQLDFGQIVTGSGLQRVVLGDSNVGIFKIHALQNQTLLLSFDADKELSHTNPAIKTTIGANLMASYSNGFNSPINSIPLKSSFTDVIIESSASSSLA